MDVSTLPSQSSDTQQQRSSHTQPSLGLNAPSEDGDPQEDFPHTGTDESNHAISVISEGSILADFAQENIDTKARSSPVDA